MIWGLTSSEACVRKAGVNANSTITASDAALADWYNQAEGYVNSETRKDWTANYSSVGTNFKVVLGNIVSSLVAQQIVNYDMGGYTSREAETILDVHENIARKGLAFLKKDENKEVMI